MTMHRNYIAGAWRDGSEGSDNINPSDLGDVVGVYARADRSETDDAIAAAIEMMRATRAEEGNIEYVFTADLSDPAVFRIYEEWQSQDALDFHFATPHMAAFGGAIAQIKPKGMDVKVYDIAGEVALPGRG